MGGRVADTPDEPRDRRRRAFPVRSAQYAEELVSLGTEVLGLVAEGRSNASIAGALYLSEKAVVQHFSRIYDSLGLDADDADAHRRVQAVLQYLDHS